MGYKWGGCWIGEQEMVLHFPGLKFDPTLACDIIAQVSTSRADVAQSAEQLFCKQQVIGSSPIVGFGRRFFESAGRK